VQVVPIRYLQGLDEAFVKILQLEVYALTQIASILARRHTTTRLELALQFVG